jgi:hypothetical protein
MIKVEMGDLSEKDQEIEWDLQHELEEVMVERRKKKLACFQKTRGRVIKKGDTMKASILVNSPFTLEELVHMIDVSINSKYGADLEGLTRTLTISMWGSVQSLRLEFKQEHENLPRQVRAMVQQVLGEARGKRDSEAPDAVTTIPSAGIAVVHVPLGSTGRMGNPGGNVSSNLPQLFYQTYMYGPGTHPVPDAYLTRPLVTLMAAASIQPRMSEKVREQVARTLR